MTAQSSGGGAVRRAPAFFILLSLAGAAFGAGESGWLETYRKGVDERAAGRWAQAAYYFLEALRANPEGGIAVKADAVTTVEYLPRLMLAECLCRMGDREMAGKYLDDALKAEESTGEAGRAVRESAEACLGAPAPVPAAREQQERILTDVRKRCGLPEQADRTLHPWHYDYEASRAFIREGMYDAGVRHLYRALDKKAKPEAKSRVYGMWFTDYHPYYLLAKAFYQQGSIECARSALEQSLRSEDLKGAPEMAKDREQMREELEALRPAGR